MEVIRQMKYKLSVLQSKQFDLEIHFCSPSHSYFYLQYVVFNGSQQGVTPQTSYTDLYHFFSSGQLAFNTRPNSSQLFCSNRLYLWLCIVASYRWLNFFFSSYPVAMSHLNYWLHHSPRLPEIVLCRSISVSFQKKVQKHRQKSMDRRLHTYVYQPLSINEPLISPGQSQKELNSLRKKKTG